jgi:hypothetical protein
MKLPVAVLPVLLACLAGRAHAEDEPITTDRPDFVESSEVVGKGRWQIETSLAWERDREAGMKTRLFGTPTLLRLGVADHWEVRLETDGRLRLKADGAGVALREHGWSDLSVGLKWHQRDGDE